jgi:uncharacterized membrane protein YcaP (DUF421 family)
MTHVSFFFDGWISIARTVVVGIAMYVALIVMLRVSGSRTLTSMNAFDFIVTVAIGAVFGRALTAKAVALAEAVTAFVLLVSLQYTVTWIQYRWPLFQRVVTNPPALLYFRGEFLEDELRRQRVTKGELESAVRKNKFDSLEAVDAVVLESSGEISVVGSVEEGSAVDVTSETGFERIFGGEE